VRLQFKPVSPGDSVLKLFDARLRKLRDLGTLSADEVIVVAHSIGQLVAGEPIAEPAFAGDPAFREKLERPIHRGIPNTRLFRAHLSKKFLDAHVTVRLQERVYDERALVGRSKPLTRHVG
jgi:hypothetical protein